MKRSHDSSHQTYPWNLWHDPKLIKPYVRTITWAWLVAIIAVATVLQLLMPRAVSLLEIWAISIGIVGGGFAAIQLDAKPNRWTIVRSFKPARSWLGWILLSAILVPWLVIVLRLAGVL